MGDKKEITDANIKIDKQNMENYMLQKKIRELEEKLEVAM